MHCLYEHSKVEAWAERWILGANVHTARPVGNPGKYANTGLNGASDSKLCRRDGRHWHRVVWVELKHVHVRVTARIQRLFVKDQDEDKNYWHSKVLK
eukprot:m.23592 g.23592  ORF g.23592 m.23592 type:complete len:97 (+) comp7519_c0_seq1:1454-1744(+)